MLFERIVSKGLAHYSYIIGDKSTAVVIDPRRDCDIYVEKAQSEGMRISYILETHRNEDYLVGSRELQSITGAEIWHADSQWDYRYGSSVAEGQKWKIGRLEIEAIHTPGHTPGMMNYLLRDPTGVPWTLFTGDTLFAGEVGRIDLLGPEKAPLMAGLLYESIFGKILPLGDDVIVCPAHGAGSVCGEAIAERTWTTIGIERKSNPRLQHEDKGKFVEDLLKSQPERPPYFTRMEEINLAGSPLLGHLPVPKPLAPGEFASIAAGAFILDTRMELGYASAHITGARSIWLDGLASFEGWFLPYDIPLLLVTETNDTREAVSILIREGYDHIAGFLGGGMLSWHLNGFRSASIATLTVHELCNRLDRGDTLWILDARSDEELKRDGRIPGAHHIHVTQIQARAEEVPRDRPIYVFCGSGLRSMIVASFLQCAGWRDLSVVLGGMSGWKSIRCPIER